MNIGEGWAVGQGACEVERKDVVVISSAGERCIIFDGTYCEGFFLNRGLCFGDFLKKLVGSFPIGDVFVDCGGQIFLEIGFEILEFFQEKIVDVNIGVLELVVCT